MALLYLLWLFVFIAGCQHFRESRSPYGAEEVEAACEEIRQAREAQERQEAEAARVAAEVERARVNEDKLRTFAIRVMPELWQTVQDLRSAEQVQAEAVETLREVAGLYGKGMDADMQAILGEQEQLRKLIARVTRKLEDAYFASLRHEALPNEAKLRAAYQQALAESEAEAIQAARTYRAMRLAK